jgi:ABC-2 type transport system ATP-binding protein
MTGEIAVQVEGAVKSLGGRRVLDGVTIRVGRGEVYGLLGPNGAGKTTLIRCLVGMVVPEQGTVTVLGTQMPDIAVLGRIGYMTQASALYPDLSVEENVRFFAEINDARGNVEEALGFVDLLDRRKSVVAALSGGLRQRVSLACALVHHPDLLLLDEPTVGIDPVLRNQFWERFQQMSAEGTTIIVSSHVMDEAERCQRLGLLRDGRLLAEGSVGDLTSLAGVPKLEDAFLKLAMAAGK